MLTSLLKPEIKDWLQKSIHSELFASNLYKHLANQMQRQGYFGLQKYFENESSDELTHYYKLRDFINDMGAVATIPAIEPFDYTVLTIGEALYKAYNAELDLLKQYQDFYEDAEESGDCVTATFTIEFLQIQRKSVGEFGDLISRYEKNPSDVFEFDEYISELLED